MALFALQKCITTMRMLAYGVMVDALNKCCCMGKQNNRKPKVICEGSARSV
jgi:hypothetical protein